MPLNRFLTRLIWLSVLPLIVLSAYLAFDHVRNIHLQSELSANRLTKNAAIAIDRLLSARIRGLTMLAIAHRDDYPAEKSNFYKAAQAFQKSFGPHVILADADMNMLFNTRLPEGAPLPRLPQPRVNAAAPKALKTGQPAVGDLFYGPIAREPLVAIAVPVNPGEAKPLLLLATLDTSQLKERLDEIELPEGWALSLRDGEGELIARKATAEALAALRDGVAEKFHSKTTLAPWTVTVEIPVSEHRAVLVNAASILLLMVIGTVLAGLITGSHASRRLRIAVGALLHKPENHQKPIAITEIETIRGLIDEAVAERGKAEAANRETQRRYIERLEKVFMSAVEVATHLGEMRDPFNAGHQRRASDLAAAIGIQLGLDANRQEGLRVAGFLYDIGKISIPAEILSRPAKLKAAEFELIKTHPKASYDVLHKVEFPWPVAEAALQHHERMDGSGYPQGLKGDTIILEARILAVADVVEAMCSHRPYRPALGVEAALAEIESGSGTRYDPAVVAACVRLFRETGYQLP